MLHACCVDDAGARPDEETSGELARPTDSGLRVPSTRGWGRGTSPSGKFLKAPSPNSWYFLVFPGVVWESWLGEGGGGLFLGYLLWEKNYRAPRCGAGDHRSSACARWRRPRWRRRPGLSPSKHLQKSSANCRRPAYMLKCTPAQRMF